MRASSAFSETTSASMMLYAKCPVVQADHGHFGSRAHQSFLPNGSSTYDFVLSDR